MDNYINDDFNTLTNIGKIFLKPAWFIRSILIILYSIVCFPLVLIHMYLYNFIKKIDYMIENIQTPLYL